MRTARHGTASEYRNHRCRCTSCRAANAAKSLAARRRRATSEPSAHGTESSYTNWMCRCTACGDAHRGGSKPMELPRLAASCDRCGVGVASRGLCDDCLEVTLELGEMEMWAA